ncbi:hypothetical protein F990_01068 [Acinetobacter tjernbergiae DSM 14971 = CIP 107465]|uniref:Uncharacterized protein n=1 Tax=Acinetobacter tjernbergiae DSM 14971 = CIP 107465 TaxID=1120928 RepID=V2V2M0_9GAMM|nr:hypothetical protein F990_01068 [Acinetobacter tjernbergiae DSM 14971 = CIP 107465]
MLRLNTVMLLIIALMVGSFKGTDIYGRFCEIEKQNCKVRILY